MKIVNCFAFIFTALPIFATSVINFSVEPTLALKNTYIHDTKDNKIRWVFAGEYGWMLSDNLSIGPGIAFSWHVEKNMTDNIAAGTDRLNSKERIIAFPIFLFAAFDPIPQNFIHPVAHVAFGYNSVVISNVDYRVNSDEQKDEIKLFDGYYNGFTAKFGLDCMFDVGKQMSLFVGPQWEISTTVRRSKKKEHYERKFNGFGLRFGVSTLL